MTKLRAALGDAPWFSWAKHLGTTRRSTWAPAVLAAGLTSWVVASIVTPTPLCAETAGVGNSADADRDGLTDLQEKILGTAPNLADPDGDGFTDLEEITRHSDPHDSASIPSTTRVNLAVFARAEADQLLVSTAVFVKNGPLPTSGFKFGAVVDGVQYTLRPRAYLEATRMQIHRTRDGGTIFVLETALVDTLVGWLGGMSFFSTVVDQLDPDVTLVQALNVTEVDGLLMSYSAIGPDETGGPTGVIYRPLVDEKDVPAEETSKGQACFQTTSTVGSKGASIVQEVESASCEEMDSFCAPTSCSAAVGTTIDLVDPGALIGG